MPSGIAKVPASPQLPNSRISAWRFLGGMLPSGTARVPASPQLPNSRLIADYWALSK